MGAAGKDGSETEEKKSNGCTSASNAGCAERQPTEGGPWGAREAAKARKKITAPFVQITKKPLIGVRNKGDHLLIPRGSYIKSRGVSSEESMKKSTPKAGHEIGVKMWDG